MSSPLRGRVQETGGQLQVFQGLPNGHRRLRQGQLWRDHRHEHRAEHAPFAHRLHLENLQARGLRIRDIGPAVSYEQFDNNQKPLHLRQRRLLLAPIHHPGHPRSARRSRRKARTGSSPAHRGGERSRTSRTRSPSSRSIPTCRNYESTSSSTGIFLVKAEGGVLLAPQWMVGAKLSYAITADYNEGLREHLRELLLRAARGSFRSDLGFSYW